MSIVFLFFMKGYDVKRDVAQGYIGKGRYKGEIGEKSHLGG